MNETPLIPENEPEFRQPATRLFERRHADGDKRDPLYQMQPVQVAGKQAATGFGMGEFQQLGYFAGVRLSEDDPLLCLGGASAEGVSGDGGCAAYLSPRALWR